MEIRPIHNEADYRATLKKIFALIDSDPEPFIGRSNRVHEVLIAESATTAAK